jgi:DNA-binding CsgD family transcriptional regulator
MMPRADSRSANLKWDEVKALLGIVDKLSVAADSNAIRENIAFDLLRLLKADFFASYIWNQGDQAFEHFVGLNVDSSNIGRYLDYYQFRDPITPLLQRRRKTTLVSEVMPQGQLERTEFFNDFLMKDNHHHGINTYAYEGDVNIGDLRIWRAKGRPPFGSHEVVILDSILPYFQNALRNARVLSKSNGTQNFWEELLNDADIALFLFNEAGRLIYRNNEASRIEKELSPEEYSSFCDYVSSNMQSDRACTKWGHFSLSVLKTSSPQDSRPLTAIFARRQESERVTSDSLRRKHQLTRRETEICIFVCKGLSDSEIGSVLGVSSTTVRTHLKHLFAKLDVASRSELTYRLFEGFLDMSF